MASGQSDLELLYDPPDKENVAVLLSTVTDWYSVGLKLGLSTRELDEIRCARSAREQKKMLAEVWLSAMKQQGETPTWEKLRTILAELKMVRAVESINKRYRPGEKKETRQLSPKLSSRPIMAQLHSIIGNNGQRYRIIQECAGQWKEVGDFLLAASSPSVIREIDKNPQLPSPYDKCRAVFEKWLDDQNSMTVRGPVTWNELLIVLDDLEKGVLVSNLKEHVLQQE